VKCEFFALILLTASFLFGCGNSGAQTENAGNIDVSFIDALGHDVTVTSAERVIVLSGSFAQTWLLAGGELLATTQDTFTDGTLLPESVQVVGSLHNPSLEQIIALEPDLVILSKAIAGHVKLYEQITAAGIVTAYFNVEVFGEYLDMLKICTDITGKSNLFEINGTDVKARIDDIIAEAEKFSHSPRVLFMRANSTDINIRNSDTMAGKMLKDLGCVNIADNENGLLENLSMEIIIEEDPDFIFAVPMGESIEKALNVLNETLKSNPAWAELTAVKNDRYFILPKDLFHLKPNNRWVESYEMLYEILYG
jgi:iron complex transport system substrate-binding protein